MTHGLLKSTLIRLPQVPTMYIQSAKRTLVIFRLTMGSGASWGSDVYKLLYASGTSSNLVSTISLMKTGVRACSDVAEEIGYHLDWLNCIIFLGIVVVCCLQLDRHFFSLNTHSYYHLRSVHRYIFPTSKSQARQLRLQFHNN